MSEKTVSDMTPHSVRELVREAPRILALWLVGDVVYAMLPVFILTAITVLLGRPFDGFLEIKEWSFATIVFFGVSIRRFVHLKVAIQRTPLSYKIDTGLQLFVVCLVSAVLVLSLVVLKEMRAVDSACMRYVGHAQITLFVMGLLSLLISVLTEEVGRRPSASATTALNNTPSA